jgi:ubiquinone/menaquinone biosynthesis C-methylase UbiE
VHSNQTSAEEVRRYWDRHPHGTQFINAPEIAAGSQEFFDRIRPNMDCYRFPYIMARIERESQTLRGKHLLEIGCGLGFDAIEFVKRGVRVTATDLTHANVELARQHFAFAGVTPEALQVEDAYDLSFPDATFDAVYSIGVLGQASDPARMIGEVHRVLKPGGRALICHAYRRPSLFYVLDWWSIVNTVSIGSEIPPVTHFFRETELRDFFKDFVIEEIAREQYRLIPSIRGGLKGAVFTWGLRPLYNLLPEAIAKPFANKASVIAVKPL